MKAVDLKTRFNKEIASQLMKDLGVKNAMAIPKLVKVVVNVGVGSYTKKHSKDFSHMTENLTAITGQKPVTSTARKAISNFKLRENDPVGIRVTLRGKRMYDFINKLVNIVFPRVRDFRGISAKAFDKKGNYSLGITEHTVFPEVAPDDLTKIHGLQVTIITSAENNEQGLALLKALGFPFKK
ncbi:MAG: 50S ribosomal protein L5 [Candidatus Gracilibacteria bacterium]|jgi:large subunit ribosomal protein L5